MYTVIVLAVGITSCGHWWQAPTPSDLLHCSFNETDNARYLEAEGHDRQTLSLPPIQLQLIASILKLQKPTVVVLFHGGQILLEPFVGLKHVTIVDAFYPGAMGGHAIANAVFGVTNRWGKLPYTVYSSNWTQNHNMLEHEMSKDARTYRYMNTENEYLILPFGYGLSLTKFNFTASTKNPNNTVYNFHLQKDVLKNDSFLLSLDLVLTNVGTAMFQKGDNVVQGYFSPTNVPSITIYPVRQLFSFQRILEVLPNESRAVLFTVDVMKDLALVTEEGDRVIEPGEYDLVFTIGDGNVNNLFIYHLILDGERHVLETFPVVKEAAE